MTSLCSQLPMAKLSSPNSDIDDRFALESSSVFCHCRNENHYLYCHDHGVAFHIRLEKGYKLKDVLFISTEHIMEIWIQVEVTIRTFACQESAVSYISSTCTKYVTIKRQSQRAKETNKRIRIVGKCQKEKPFRAISSNYPCLKALPNNI